MGIILKLSIKNFHCLQQIIILIYKIIRPWAYYKVLNNEFILNIKQQKIGVLKLMIIRHTQIEGLILSASSCNKGFVIRWIGFYLFALQTNIATTSTIGSYLNSKTIFI